MKIEVSKMKHSNKELIKNWNDNATAMQDMTKHTTAKIKSKSTINSLLSIAPTRFFGGTSKATEIKGVRMVKASNTYEMPVVALQGILGDKLDTLPDFLNTYYPDALQRPDYKQAVAIAKHNLTKLGSRKLRSASKAVKYLFATTKDDPQREAKRIILDVARAVNLSMINHYKGTQLTVEAGRGVTLTQADLAQCMTVKATYTQITAALMYLRVAGFVQLASSDQLSGDEKTGGKYFVLRQLDGFAGAWVFVVNDFEQADWGLIADELNVSLSTRMSAYVVEQLVGQHDYQEHFYDYRTGAGVTTFDYLQHIIYAKLDDAAKRIATIEGVSTVTAYRYIDQALMVKGMWLQKITIKEAIKQNYNTDLLDTTALNAKVIVPIRHSNEVAA